MTDLLKNDVAWYWSPDKTNTFAKVKDLLTEAPTLAHNKRNSPIVVRADSSRVGLAAAIYLQDKNQVKPIALALRTLTETEKKRTQIELVPVKCI